MSSAVDIVVKEADREAMYVAQIKNDLQLLTMLEKAFEPYGMLNRPIFELRGDQTWYPVILKFAGNNGYISFQSVIENKKRELSLILNALPAELKESPAPPPPPSGDWTLIQ
jgi:hypothetical protein